MEISFFFLTFHFYGFIIGLAIVAVYFVTLKRSKKYQPKEEVAKIFFIVLVFGVIGARVYHVLDLREYYLKNPGEIVAIWEGGLGIFGAVIGGITGLVLLRRSKLLLFLDLLSPGIFLGQAIGRIGNFFNQEAFGLPTDLPWGVFIEESKRPAVWATFQRFHPTFFYESLWMLIGFFLVLYLERRLNGGVIGLLFAFYLIWYGIGRFFLEFLRFDTAKLGLLPVAQILSLIFIIAGFLLYFNGKRNGKR